MNLISIVAKHSTSTVTATEESLKTVALFSCFGLLVSVCMTTLGLDVSAGWL